MKKTNFITGSFLMLFTTILISCGSGSVKGNWSDADKAKFHMAMKVHAGLEKSEYTECYLLKCEAAYESFATADSDKEGVAKLAEECGDEVLSNGSVLGNWSDEDKAQFRKDMSEAGLSSILVECYLLKCEAAFKSYWRADTDESGLISEIATECTETITEEEITE
mgnify:CR=1 FL=1|tara:strand:+ start:247 stop:744 length:498 start_codon:yes stop_codon:yes gene_type:complete